MLLLLKYNETIFLSFRCPQKWIPDNTEAKSTDTKIINQFCHDVKRIYQICWLCDSTDLSTLTEEPFWYPHLHTTFRKATMIMVSNWSLFCLWKPEVLCLIHLSDWAKADLWNEGDDMALVNWWFVCILYKGQYSNTDEFTFVLASILVTVTG